MIKLFLFLIITTFFSTDLLSQDSSDSICHLNREEILRIEFLREAMSVVDLTVGKGDIATNIGLGVIDSSCLNGRSQALQNQIISKIRNSINLAIERSRNCYQYLRVREMPDVIAVLERTRFRCEEFEENDLVASMRRTSREYNACGEGIARFTLGAHRSYEMTISAPTNEVRSNVDFAIFLSDEELASFFAHESMHVLAMNNKDWHNDFDPNVRTRIGCTSSLFEDRIYFTQAVCFPESNYGRNFYADNGAYQCPEVCQAALTQVDEAASRMYASSSVPGSERTSSFGPSQVARAYPLEEAQRLCHRIRSLRGSSLISN